jgi:D-alanyl-D-alanine carboxypeptidase/D-alanyl-D-alanine-endopeptidase (penicillin-binding protein 4)
MAIVAATGGCGGSHASATRQMASSPPALATTTSPLVRPRVPVIPRALRTLRLSLAGGLRHVSGPGAVVFDLTAHKTLFELNAGVPRPPASLEKLYTSLALLTRLGANTELTTRVMGVGHLGPRGVWHGNLYLRGGGDPTFGDGTFNLAWNEGQGPTAAQLVGQLASRGIRRVKGQVVGDPSLFDSAPGGPSTDFAPDIPDLGGQLSGLTYDHGATAGTLSPGAFAARELALTMRRQRIRARASRTTGSTPAGAEELAAVSSPPLLTMLKLMNVRSDDFFAEMLTKQLGVRLGAGGTTAAGARVISGTAARYGLHPTIVDGSGLSRADRTTPQGVVALLRALWHTTAGRELALTLPVVGVSGTTARIGVHTRAQGQCSAKTGTLNGVTNLAGYCRASGGHTLAFALFLDGPPIDQARRLLTRMVGAIASY